MSNKSLHFKTNVLLKNVIGKDLINDDNIAILELVKNSYDAGSKIVNVTFENIKKNDDSTIPKPNPEPTPNTSKIIIQDFGKGMSLEDINDKWLNIAYSDKKNKSNEMGRIFAGAKGIGRFSCDRLGEYLDLYTKKHNTDIIHLKVDWKNFEIENKKDLMIQNIPVEFNTIDSKEFEKMTGHKYFEKGTIIEISKLRSTWTSLEGKRKKYWVNSNLLSLRRSLEKLINPNQIFNKDKFAIYLTVKEFIGEDKATDDISKKINGEIKNQIFNKLSFTTTSIESLINESGDLITTTLKDKDREIFKLVEKNKQFKLLPEVKIVLFFLNQYAKIYFARETGFSSIDFGSVFLFINGFRIPPYGDKNDDWLKMEIRKGQGTRRFLSGRDLVGRIEIKDLKNNFKIISSREGIVKDSAFKQLTDESTGFYYKTLRRIEKYVVEGLRWDSVRNKDMTEEEKRERKKYVQNITKKVNAHSWKYNKEDEIYGESASEKNKRIIEILYDIINVQPEDIIKLDINSELIEQLSTEEDEKVKLILEDFSKYDSNIFSRGTKNALKKIEEILIDKDNRLKLAKEQNLEIQSELNKVKKEVEERIGENLFLRSITSTDIKEVISLQHHIERGSDRIERNLKALKDELLLRKSAPELFSYVEKINLEVRKIITISKLITRANFNTEAKTITKDIIEFLTEYIENVYKNYQDLKINNKLLKFRIINNAKNRFITKFSPLEVIIVFDNLIDNSQKAGARNFNIEFKLEPKETLKIYYTDDGDGIDSKISDRIFEFGFTTKKGGSGIGLYHVKRIIDDLGGSIVVNNKLDKGAQFIMELKR